MITHSPESPMPEPYRTYVRQRAQTIASVLEPVVGDTDVQLCPRAITPDEAVVDRRGGGLVYGCVVNTERDGLKTALYSGHEFATGIAAYSLDEALRYANQLLHQGNLVRIKDPRHSDGDGQSVASSLEEVANIVDGYGPLAQTGLVLMPDMESVLDRYTAGRINLGQHGAYRYYGHEYAMPHEGRSVFGGGDIVLGRDSARPHLEEVAEQSGVPQHIRRLADAALSFYQRQIVYMGRASVDVIRGITHNGSELTTVVDQTPRVGGHTAAETLGIAALRSERARAAKASGRLLYSPASTPHSGTNFVDTPTLVINAVVTEVC